MEEEMSEFMKNLRRTVRKRIVEDDMMNKWNQVYPSPSRAAEMLESGEGADCVIEVVQMQQEQQQENDAPRKIQGEKAVQQQTDQREEFNVHKFILIANSEVFAAMFRHKNTKEFRESRIQIKDSSITAVRQMINYLYTGKVPDSYYDYDDDDAEKDILPLMTIAHKYQIKPLIEFNEQILSRSLTLENVFERLKLADFYQANALKSACGRKIWDNVKDLKGKAEWIQLKKSSPELAFFINEELL